MKIKEYAPKEELSGKIQMSLTISNRRAGKARLVAGMILGYNTVQETARVLRREERLLYGRKKTDFGF